MKSKRSRFGGISDIMSLTPDVNRKVGVGLAPSPSPFFTPRPERRRGPDPRGIDYGSNRLDKDKEVNVQVLVRCRPLNDDEQRINVPKAITCNESKREISVVQNVANKQVDKVFTFDKVFGPKAQQRSIYDQAISPIVKEVLDGFNCTVFAYGQTGTGKTYTMEGGMRNKAGELPAEAGIIPRAVRQIFDTLEAQHADYSMKVTFWELYNEEIIDLLASEEPSKFSEERQRKPISLMEDGKGLVVVRGLEEEAVYSANDIYNLLERGAARRRTADTLLNKRSSRSHSVFSITIHVKEMAVGDEELIKCGKLNLVDLAGSENISRSGAREGRAREAGEINKSLLTLGRVITALVEHSIHVPYRDSKLTRLLRDSLGGKTKTCIIATISPSAHCLEETLSTLDYAHRAKNIKNKPEANQRMSKSVLLKDLYLELERMKQDVRAAREKNGVYVPHERFLQDEVEKKAKNEKIEQLEIDLNISEKKVDKFRELYLSEQEEKLNLKAELKDCKANLENSKKVLHELQDNYRIAISTLKEKELIISKQIHSENCLIDCAKDLRKNLQNASEDITSLFARIDHKDKLEADNQNLLCTFGSRLDDSLNDLHKVIHGLISQQQQQLRGMEEHVNSFLASKCDVTKVMESKINKMTQTYTSGMASLKELVDTVQLEASSDLDHIKSKISSQATAVEKFLRTASLEAKDFVCDIKNSLDEQRQVLDFSAKQQEEGLRRSLVSAQLISQATVNFFDDLHQRASEVMKLLDKNNINTVDQLQKFEKEFKEEALREENLALEKIAAILETLTTKREAMVSEASRNIQDSSAKENKLLLQEISGVQQVSASAKQKLNGYINEVKQNFLEDTFTHAENRMTLENCLQECTNKVDNLNEQLGETQLGVQKILTNNLAEIEQISRETSTRIGCAYDEFISTSSSVDGKVEAHSCDLQTSFNDSLTLDMEHKKRIESMSCICLNQLSSTQQNHGECISDIQCTAEQCLQKDYMVDMCTDKTPMKRLIQIPSLSSIEDMRTVISKVSLENEHKWSGGEGKNQRQQCTGVSPNRTPFADVN
ncbi:kinesin-like protein KIN-5B isoform X2 [Solanum dulcamara]|uniref:kinesin-like protein KIN-5B isoform X2 n=1 Tax=Solanum dulcamara TaxID=45834 RepID=UPI0024867531|nr:kinesin-like protein KIN-5B isoform X2 [Solanum dulcamara]